MAVSRKSEVQVGCAVLSATGAQTRPCSWVRVRNTVQEFGMSLVGTRVVVGCIFNIDQGQTFRENVDIMWHSYSVCRLRCSKASKMPSKASLTWIHRCSANTAHVLPEREKMVNRECCCSEHGTLTSRTYIPSQRPFLGGVVCSRSGLTLVFHLWVWCG